MSAKRKTKTGTIWAAVAAIVCCYVLSYAPVLRWMYPAEGPWGTIVYPPLDPVVYRPVMWLIDNTPCREPLLWWAGVWGMDDPMRYHVEIRKAYHP
jgi:hypothetical protein